MEKYFDETTQEIMYEWVVNAVYSDDEASSAVYKVMATRSQIQRILNSFGDDVKRRGAEIYEENEASTFDGSIYDYSIFYCDGESWIEATAYLVEKMNVFYEKDFVGGDTND